MSKGYEKILTFYLYKVFHELVINEFHNFELNLKKKKKKKRMHKKSTFEPKNRKYYLNFKDFFLLESNSSNITKDGLGLASLFNGISTLFRLFNA